MPPGSTMNDTSRTVDKMWHDLAEEQRKVYTNAFLQQRDEILIQVRIQASFAPGNL